MLCCWWKVPEDPAVTRLAPLATIFTEEKTQERVAFAVLLVKSRLLSQNQGIIVLTQKTSEV